MKKRFVVFCYLVPVMLSLLLIGAHFLRSGNLLVPVVSLLLIVALAIREPLVARAVQLALLLATAEWVWVAFDLVSARLDAGLPWTKLALILGAVAVLALVSVALFFSQTLQAMYHLGFAAGQTASNPIAPPLPALTGCPQPEPAMATGARRKLLAVYKLKSTLTTCSLVAFLLMDYSLGLGMVALIAIGLINTALRRKMRGIGGVLSAADWKQLYVRQALGLGLLSLPIIGYYFLTLPVLNHRLIVDSIIAGFTLLLWAGARYEYLLHRGQEECVAGA